MVCPNGACRVDNTHLPLEAVVAQIGELIKVAALPR
jgi:hypothetical protein